MSWKQLFAELVALLNKWGAAFGVWLMGSRHERLKQAERNQRQKEGQHENDIEYERRRHDPDQRDRVRDAIDRARDE